MSRGFWKILSSPSTRGSSCLNKGLLGEDCRTHPRVPITADTQTTGAVRAPPSTRAAKQEVTTAGSRATVRGHPEGENVMPQGQWGEGGLAKSPAPAARHTLRDHSVPVPGRLCPRDCQSQSPVPCLQSHVTRSPPPARRILPGFTDFCEAATRHASSYHDSTMRPVAPQWPITSTPSTTSHGTKSRSQFLVCPLPWGPGTIGHPKLCPGWPRANL